MQIYEVFFIRRKRGVKISFRGAIYRCLYGKRGTVRAERETALVKRRAAWLQQGRHGHNRDGFDKRGGGFGKQGAACITGGALRTQQDGMDTTGRRGQQGAVRTKQSAPRTKSETNFRFVARLSLSLRGDRRRAGRSNPAKFCADTHLRTVYAVFAINLRYEGRETDTCHQRRRLRFERTCGGRGGRARLRPRGRGGARNDAERHEPSHHDVQPAVPALCAEGRGAGGVRLFRHAGGLREDGVRLPAARRARRSGNFGHQPRLQLRRERALFGDDGRGDRRQLLRLSRRRAVARRPRRGRRFRGGGGVRQADRGQRARKQDRAAALWRPKRRRAA